MKQPGSARRSSRSSASSRPVARSTGRTGRAAQELVICVKNDGYEASLELRKIYRVLEDADAVAHRLLRVVDESGEGYLYPRDHFIPAILPPATRRAVLATA